jgi:hypothetical protein
MKTRITDPAQLNIYGDGVIEDKDFKLFIAKYAELSSGVRPSAILLLDALVITATEGGKRDTLIKLPLKEYMEMRGRLINKSTLDETRKQVKEDLEALFNIKISFSNKRRNPITKKYETENFLDMRLCDAKGIINGAITFNFGGAFYTLLKSYPVMPYPKEILTFNLKYNPHSPRLLRRLAEHRNMNYNHPGGGLIISVKTLLEACPELVKHNELGEAGQVRKRIIEPFERDMDAIKSIKWHYCGTKGAIIEPPLTYKAFEQANIQILWEEYPERKTKAIRGKRTPKEDPGGQKKEG